MHTNEDIMPVLAMHMPAPDRAIAKGRLITLVEAQSAVASTTSCAGTATPRLSSKSAACAAKISRVLHRYAAYLFKDQWVHRHDITGMVVGKDTGSFAIGQHEHVRNERDLVVISPRYHSLFLELLVLPHDLRRGAQFEFEEQVRVRTYC